MTEHNETESNQDYNEDSTTDVIAAVSLVLIAVAFMIYWVSNQTTSL